VPSDRAVEAPAQTMQADQMPPPTCRLELNQCLDRARTEAERKKSRDPRGLRPPFASSIPIFYFLIWYTVEHLQAAEVWTFVPVSEVEAFSPALISANRTLLEGIPPNHQLTYRVQDPLDCFARLESLTFGLSQEQNPVLLPFGPKIFSLCALLVSLLNPSIPVWRVSAEGQEVPVNREPSGFVYGLEVVF
jgi:hypothetical protein